MATNKAYGPVSMKQHIITNVPDIVLKFFVINRYSIMKYLQEVRMQLRESIEMYMRYSVSYINMRNMLWTA